MKPRILRSDRALRFGFLLTLAASVVFVAANWSAAAPLLPNTTLYPAPLGPLPGGALVAGGVPVPFATAGFTGTLTSSVFAGDGTNPLGGLTFVYVLQNNVASPGEIDRITVASFAGFATDADYAPVGMVVPTLIDRSADSSTVGFSFIQPPVGPGALLPGQVSDMLVVYTDAPFYAATLANVIDNNVVRVASFAPLTVIPEPSTLILAGLAAFGLAVFVRRQHS